MSTTTTAQHTPFELIQFRVASAYWRWKVWKQLFMGDPAQPEIAKNQVKLLERFGTTFFSMVKELIVHDVILSICKLRDPDKTATKTGQRENLSLANALSECRARLSAADAKAAQDLVDQFSVRTEAFKTRRHWTVAHDDRRVATGADTAPAITDADVDAALDGAVKVLELLDPAMPGCHFAYRDLIARGDGNSLVFALRCAERYMEECHAQGRRPLE